LTVLGAAAALLTALWVRRRFAEYRTFRGLDMLTQSRQRLIVLALTIFVFLCQIGRTLIVFRAPLSIAGDGDVLRRGNRLDLVGTAERRSRGC
jgi:hypothetical protein